jgi:hypothetical protein
VDVSETRKQPRANTLFSTLNVVLECLRAVRHNPMSANVVEISIPSFVQTKLFVVEIDSPTMRDVEGERYLWDLLDFPVVDMSAMFARIASPSRGTLSPPR